MSGSVDDQVWQVSKNWTIWFAILEHLILAVLEQEWDKSQT
jgi:hypothetical protein